MRQNQQKAEIFYKTALGQLKAGNGDGALDNFAKAAANDPADSTIYYNRGVIFYKGNDLKSAQREFEKALELDAGYVEAMYGLGLTCSDMGEREKAVEYFNSCLSADPAFAKAKDKLNNLSRVNRSSQGNVVIIELLYHWDYFITTVKLLEVNHNVSLVLSKSFRDHLQKNYDFNLKKYNLLVIDRVNFEVISEFITNTKAEKLFINTIQGYELTRAFASFCPQVPYFVTIHNFDLWLGLRHIATGNQPGAGQINQSYMDSCKQIIANSAGLISIDQNVRDYIAPQTKGKPVYVMPWVVNEEKLEAKVVNSSLMFTVPAGIEKGRRNYGVVLEAAKKMGPLYPELSFVFLGRPIGEYGEIILKAADKINSNQGREVVKTFDKYIHEDVYNDFLQKSDFFILPLQYATLGKYKASAAMYDALVKGRPVLIPEELYFSQSFSAEYGEGFIVYDDLTETMKELQEMSDMDMANLQQAAAINANRFQKDIQVEQTEKQFFG